jgi:hypothetical protein
MSDNCGSSQLLHSGLTGNLDLVRCPQPWPRPTSHVPDGDAEQRRRRPLSAPSHPAPATPAPDSFTTLHAAACAVLCGGHQERACPQPLWSWWRANPGSTAAWHTRNGCVLPRAHLTHCPPALLHGAPCGAHILQRHEPHGCRCRTAAAHAPPPPPSPHACKRKLVASSFCCAALCGADP